MTRAIQRKSRTPSLRVIQTSETAGRPFDRDTDAGGK